MNTDVSTFDSTIPGGWKKQNRGRQKESPSQVFGFCTEFRMEAIIYAGHEL